MRAQSASGENMQPIALFLALVFITLGLSNTVPLNGQTTVDGTSQRPVCLLLRYVYRGKCPSLFSVSASEVSGTFLSRYRVGYSMKNVQIFIIVDLRWLPASVKPKPTLTNLTDRKIPKPYHQRLLR